jgi:hypothetical protein
MVYWEPSSFSPALVLLKQRMMTGGRRLDRTILTAHLPEMN